MNAHVWWRCITFAAIGAMAIAIAGAIHLEGERMVAAEHEAAAARDRDEAVRQRDAAVGDRDRSIKEKQTALRERDVAQSRAKAAIAREQTARRQRDAAIANAADTRAERDAAKREVAALRDARLIAVHAGGSGTTFVFRGPPASVRSEVAPIPHAPGPVARRPRRGAEPDGEEKKPPGGYSPQAEPSPDVPSASVTPSAPGRDDNVVVRILRAVLIRPLTGAARWLLQGAARLANGIDDAVDRAFGDEGPGP